MVFRKVKKLKNGLRVVYVPFKGIDSVSFRLFGKAGALWENMNELGVAHFLEHVVFEGTEKYDTAEKLSRIVSDVGGKNNGGTGFYNVGYEVKLLKDDIERGFDFLSQLFIYPLLREKDTLKHRKIITQELKNELDDPISRFFINSLIINYPEDTRLFRPIIGTKESVANTTREDLNNFMKKHYSADNFVLGVCGDLDENKIFALSENYFNPMKSGAKNDYLVPPTLDEFGIYTENNDQIQQATLSLTFPAPKEYEDDHYPTGYLTRILGVGDISRLFMEIRQKRGLAYSTGASYHSSPVLGSLTLYAQIDEKNYKEVLKIFKEEITKIVNNDVSEIEYERTKKHIISSFVFGDEKPAVRVEENTILILDDKDNENYETTLNKYKDVEIKDINKIAKTIFNKPPKLKLLSHSLKQDDILSYWKSLN